MQDGETSTQNDRDMHASDKEIIRVISRSRETLRATRTMGQSIFGCTQTTVVFSCSPEPELGYPGLLVSLPVTVTARAPHLTSPLHHLAHKQVWRARNNNKYIVLLYG